jgi:hypothetical protein
MPLLLLLELLRVVEGTRYHLIRQIGGQIPRTPTQRSALALIV